MENEIINRVANSNLQTIDLEDFYPAGERIQFDIKDWLFEELILKEKDFREHVANFDWSTLQGKYVALHCSVDAIIPSWAYILISTQLIPYAKKVVIGGVDLLENVIFTEIINKIDTSIYKDKPVIVKGCANKPIPESAYTLLIEKILPLAKSIMYGEACSTVPLYKKTK